MFKDVHLFLDKFNTIKPPERSVQESVVKAIVRVLGITIRRAEISVRGSVIYITTTSVVKSEIMIGKSEILKELSGGLAGRTVKDIL